MMRSAWLSTFLSLSILGGYFIPAFAQTCPPSQTGGGTDHIIFVNNDSLSGEILSINDNSIAFVSQSLGRITVPWTTVRSIESNNRIAIASPTASSSGNTISFKTAMIEQRLESLVLRTDDQTPRLIAGVLEFSDPGCSATPIAVQQPPPQAQPSTIWTLDIKAPASLAFGTSSQVTFGGNASVNIYSGRIGGAPRYHTELAASGSHNRSWQIGSPFVVTDTLDAFFQQSRSFSSNRGGIYGKAEGFLNTSLGMAVQESIGAGYFSPSKKLGPLQFKWLADLRYFRERLYATPGTLDLAGSRFEGQLTYRKQDPSDATKTKYSVIVKSWINPMWNNENALQGYASLMLSVPLRRSVCLGFNPIEDDYLRNAPAGNKKNYATSSINLTIEHGSSASHRCY